MIWYLYKIWYILSMISLCRRIFKHDLHIAFTHSFFPSRWTDGHRARNSLNLETMGWCYYLRINTPSLECCQTHNDLAAAVVFLLVTYVTRLQPHHFIVMLRVKRIKNEPRTRKCVKINQMNYESAGKLCQWDNDWKRVRIKENNFKWKLNITKIVVHSVSWHTFPQSSHL